MRLHRFYIKQSLGEELVVDTKEILKQWFLVFRLNNGDNVVLFNADGQEYTYTIKDHDKNSAQLSFLTKKKVTSPTHDVSLCVSLIKKDKLEWVIEKATELGVSSFLLFTSERSEKKAVNIERLEKIAIEASEQSGRGTIPTITVVKDTESALKETNTIHKRYFFDIEGLAIREVSHKDAKTRVTVFVGPEGGWGANEKALFKKERVDAVALTRTTLRAETAAIVGVSYFLI